MSEENQSIPATSDSGDQNDHTGDDVKGSDDAAQEDHFKSAKMNQGDKRQPITAKKKKKPLSIGFLGAGMMASAIMDGLVQSGETTPDNIICSDPWPPAIEKAKAAGYKTAQSNQRVSWMASDVLLLAVKPAYIEAVCNDIIAGPDGSDACIISVAAGVSLQTLEELLPNRRVIRVMPNMAAAVQQTAAAYCLGSLAQKTDEERVQRVFGSCGLLTQVSDEAQLHAVTGVSGSGPAYVFDFIQALADGGVRVGLSRAQALELAAQTCKGAAEMVLQKQGHPGELRDRVCSPGGTTIAGVDALEQGGMRSAVLQAVKAAARRSMQLGGATEEEITEEHNL